MTKFHKTLAPRCKSILGMIVAGMLLFGGATQAQNMKQKITLTVKKQTKVEISLAANANNTKIQFQQPDMMAMWVNVINTTDTLITISPSNAGTIEIYGDVTTLAIKRNNHNILEIDASGNTALKKIDCMDDSLKSLNVTNCTALTSLGVNSSRISSLDISTNTALTSLHCVSNKNLTSLDVSKNTALTYLDCTGNNLTSLDISQNTKLCTLHCGANQLISLDVSNNPDLCELEAYLNNFSTEEFDRLMCSLPMRTPEKEGYFNPIYSTSGSSTEKDNFAKSNVTNATAKNWEVRDVDNNEVLTTTGTYSCVQVNSDRYITLTVTKDNLITIRLATDSANIPIKIVSGTWDTTIITADNKVTDAIKCNAAAETMTIYGDVKSFRCNDNKTITRIDISNNTALTELRCYGNNLTSLDVSNNTALTNLQCGFNQLTSLDVSKNTALTELSCYTNQLTSLDVSKNTALTNLQCGYNQLTSLDVTKNTALTSLSCVTNQLTSIDVSKNTALTFLNCYNNQLTSLELSNCIELQRLICCNNKLTSLNVADCIDLVTLKCYTNNFTTQAYEDLMCSLNYKEAKNKTFTPLLDKNDANVSAFMATTAKNAIKKGWNIIYDSLDDEGNVMEITETTGNNTCPLMVNTSNCIKLIVTKGTDIGFGIIVQQKMPIRIVCGSVDTVMLIEKEEIRILAENEIVNIYGYVRGIVINKFNNPVATVKILEAKDNISLRWVDIEDISSMTTLNVSGCSTLDDIVCKQTKNIASLNISGCPNLKTLICKGTKLTTLNLKGFKNLISLSCDSNSNLTSLNIEGCTSLNYLSSVGTKFSTQGYDSLMCYLPQGGGYYYPLLHKDDENAAAFMATNANNATAKNWLVRYGETDEDITTTGSYDCNGLSIEEGDAMGIALYPNPAKTMLNIENAIGNVQIFDITGRMLINVENKETNLLQINVSNLSKGMYFVKVGNYITKFVKE